MPTTQKSQQKHTKATQKVGGSAKKPVTKAIEGGKVAPSKGKMTRGGSAKGGGNITETVKGKMPVTMKKFTEEINRLNRLEQSIGALKTDKEIHSKKLETLTAQIKAIFRFLDKETQNKINNHLESTGNYMGNQPTGNLTIEIK
jgi:hypothetical protein